jgi:hypothetical protein
MTDADDTETVYVSPGSTYTTRYYHTDRDCDLLGKAPREWVLGDANAFGYELCSLCEADGDHGEITHTGDQSRSLRDLLEDDDSGVEYIDGHAGVDG